jgi:hypothetical protein
MGFGTTVEDGRSRRSRTFFSFECGFKSFFDEAFAEVADGLGVAVKLFGNVAIGHSTVFGFIAGEQDIGVFDLLGIAFVSLPGSASSDISFFCR